MGAALGRRTRPSAQPRAWPSSPRPRPAADRGRTAVRPGAGARGFPPRPSGCGCLRTHGREPARRHRLSGGRARGPGLLVPARGALHRLFGRAAPAPGGPRPRGPDPRYGDPRAEGADPDHRARHARADRGRPRRRTFSRWGDPGDRFYVVLDGWVRLYRETPDGAEITIALFARGESFAEAAMLGPGQFPVCAVVAEPSRLLDVPASSFLGALEADRMLCRNLMASMARRLQAFVRQIEALSRRSTVERLAAFLVELSEGRRPPVVIELPLDKTLVAARLGMQPESLSRAFARLRRLGVTTVGHAVRIEDVDALEGLAEPDSA
ncbi:MAG: Crp/Fnr family transcriptional regulator [Geminicoccaceae bacterium]|nr:Crp/Fnr family transcriptional regulator [Geminicoccaceae bacterium]MDW8369759.1 Crp/Fnr family transcriptional regulator [Geminicoccaceae bacterium]